MRKGIANIERVDTFYVYSMDEKSGEQITVRFPASCYAKISYRGKTKDISSLTLFNHLVNLFDKSKSLTREELMTL